MNADSKVINMSEKQMAIISERTAINSTHAHRPVFNVS